MQIIILDTETTGLQAPQACEIGFIELQGTVSDFKLTKVENPISILKDNSIFISVYEQRFRPTKPIEAGASKVTGIYMKDVLHCPSITTFEFPTTVKYMIGHNVAFDHRVLDKPDVKLICTKELAQLVFPKQDGLKSLKLTTLIEWLYPKEGKELVEKAHGALLDCKLVFLVLHKILEKLPQIDTWEQLSGLCSQGKKTYEEMNKPVEAITIMPFGKHQGAAIVNLPLTYLKWLLTLDNLSPPLRLAVQEELDSRK